MLNTRTFTRRILATLLATTLLACGNSNSDDKSGSSERNSLVDHDEWVLVGAADDPFEDRPDVVDCPEGFEAEEFGSEDSFEVNTDECMYLTAFQPSLRDIAAGQSVSLRVYHVELTSDDPAAEAHVAIALGGDVMWEMTLAIPAGARLIDVSFDAPQDFPTGTPIHFHIHNHGPNSYNLIRVEED